MGEFAGTSGNDDLAAEDTSVPSHVDVAHAPAAKPPFAPTLATFFPLALVAVATYSFGSPRGDAALAGSTAHTRNRSSCVHWFSLFAVKKPKGPSSSDTADIVSHCATTPLRLFQSFASLTYFSFHLRPPLLLLMATFSQLPSH